MLSKRIFYLNSRSRLTGTNSDFSYKIDMKDLDCDRVAVLAVNIPKSYYLIQDGENVFTLQEGVSTAVITINPANYSRSTMRTAVQTALNAESPNGWTYAMTFSATTAGETGKYTWTVTGNGGVQPNLIFTDNNIYEIMGFEMNSTNYFVADTLTSANVIKLQKEDTIFIHSDLCSNSESNILQEIYANNNSDFSNIVFYTPDAMAYSKKLTTNNNNIFQFWLTNEDTEAINLNGQNWTMTIVVYKQDNRLFDFVKAYAKIKG